MSSDDKCPVKHSNSTAADPTSLGSKSTSLWSYLWNSNSTKNKEEPILTMALKEDSDASCPNGAGGTKTSRNLASLEEANRYAQTPQPDQRIQLGTERKESSIPRLPALDNIPVHQSGTKSPNWVYPSEQQLYNAMRKKGWKNIPEESIPVVLEIHNTINERTWRLIKEWEGDENIQLTRFTGRPKDISPKAFIFSYVLGFFDPPFDRHDWYIQHNPPNGEKKIMKNIFYPEEQRYVIDFYYLRSSQPDSPPIPYVDARPALDTPRAFYLRGKRMLEDSLPGITRYLKERKQNQYAGSSSINTTTSTTSSDKSGIQYSAGKKETRKEN